MQITLRSVLGILICTTVFLIGPQANAENSWYHGTVKRIYLAQDGFVLTMNSTALDDCQYKYVYYRSSVLGDKAVDRALSIALAAQASGRIFGTVIDKSINGPGGECDSNGSTDISD